MGNKKSKHQKQTKELSPSHTTAVANTQNSKPHKLVTPAKTRKQPITHDHKRRKKKVEDEFAGTLVIDNGSYLIRAGFCGDSAPRGVFSPIVGRPKHQNVMVGMKNVYVGDEAVSKRGILNNKYAIQNGIVQNWDDMTEIWKHTFYNEMRISPEEHPLLLTESPFNPKENRVKTVEIMLEQFNVPSLYLANSSLCAMIASGRSTAIVLDSSYQSTSIWMYLNNDTIKEQIMIGGFHVEQYWQKQLDERGYSFKTTAELKMIEKMKHDLGYVALDYDDAMYRAETASELSQGYELPDGSVIDSGTLATMRFQCSECLFTPSLIGVESIGISKLLAQVIRGSGEYIQEICANVLINGGNSKLNGFADRIQSDVDGLINENDRLLAEGYVRLNNVDDISTRNIVDLICKYDPKLKVKCVAPPERSYSVWIGASVLVTSLTNDMYITTEDYYEYGANILDKKCKFMQ